MCLDFNIADKEDTLEDDKANHLNLISGYGLVVHHHLVDPKNCQISGNVSDSSPSLFQTRAANERKMGKMKMEKLFIN